MCEHQFFGEFLHRAFAHHEFVRCYLKVSRLLWLGVFVCVYLYTNLWQQKIETPDGCFV